MFLSRFTKKLKLKKNFVRKYEFDALDKDSYINVEEEFDALSKDKLYQGSLRNIKFFFFDDF